MSKQVIIVSPPGQRMTIQMAGGVLHSKPAEGDGYTHVEIEATGEAPEPPVRPRGEEPPPPWLIGMSLVGGLPQGMGAADLQGATRISGPLSLHTLAEHLDELAEGASKVFILGGDRGD